VLSRVLVCGMMSRDDYLDEDAVLNGGKRRSQEQNNPSTLAEAFSQVPISRKVDTML